MTWTESKQRTQVKELLWQGGIVFAVAVGIIVEIFVRVHGPIFIVDDYGDISLSVISIEATVATLVITILSLMTGKIDQSYLGVGINDFLLNIKPQIFKQKTLFISELILIAVNVCLQIFGCYNIVISIFFVSLFLIGISVFEVYEAFVGSEDIAEEIKEYMTDDCYDKRLKMQKMLNLAKQWDKEIVKQTNHQYEDYASVNNKLFPSVFCSTDGRQQLLSIYKQVTETLLDSKNDAAVIRALGFVQSCYLQEWYFIRYHNFNCSDIQFNLFAEVNTEMYAAVESIDINKLQNTFYWPTFTQIILRDAVFLLSDEAKEIRQDKSINNSDNNEISNSIKMSASIEHLTDEEALLRSNPDINAIEDFCGYLVTAD